MISYSYSQALTACADETEAASQTLGRQLEPAILLGSREAGAMTPSSTAEVFGVGGWVPGSATLAFFLFDVLQKKNKHIFIVSANFNPKRATSGKHDCWTEVNKSKQRIITSRSAPKTRPCKVHFQSYAPWPDIRPRLHPTWKWKDHNINLSLIKLKKNVNHCSLFVLAIPSHVMDTIGPGSVVDRQYFRFVPAVEVNTPDFLI